MKLSVRDISESTRRDMAVLGKSPSKKDCDAINKMYKLDVSLISICKFLEDKKTIDPLEEFQLLHQPLNPITLYEYASSKAQQYEVCPYHLLAFILYKSKVRLTPPSQHFQCKSVEEIIQTIAAANCYNEEKTLQNLMINTLKNYNNCSPNNSYRFTVAYVFSHLQEQRNHVRRGSALTRLGRALLESVIDLLLLLYLNKPGNGFGVYGFADKLCDTFHVKKLDTLFSLAGFKDCNDSMPFLLNFKQRNDTHATVPVFTMRKSRVLSTLYRLGLIESLYIKETILGSWHFRYTHRGQLLLKRAMHYASDNIYSRLKTPSLADMRDSMPSKLISTNALYPSKQDIRVKDADPAMASKPVLEQDNTLLMNACISFNLNDVDLLLSNGVNVMEKRMKDGKNALHLTCAGTRTDENFDKIITALLSKEPRLAMQVDFDGNTPLHVLTAQGNGLHIKLFTAHPKIKAMMDEGYPIIDSTNAKGQTALMIAIEKRCSATVKLLLEVGANGRLPDLNNNTALHYAAIFGNVVILAELLKSRPDVNQQNAMGDTALHLAIRHNHPEVAMTLINHGANISLKNGKHGDGKSLLDYYHGQLSSAIINPVNAASSASSSSSSANSAASTASSSAAYYSSTANVVFARIKFQNETFLIFLKHYKAYLTKERSQQRINALSALCDRIHEQPHMPYTQHIYLWEDSYTDAKTVQRLLKDAIDAWKHPGYREHYATPYELPALTSSSSSSPASASASSTSTAKDAASTEFFGTNRAVNKAPLPSSMADVYLQL